MTARGIRMRPLGLALLPILAGCVEINRAPASVYSTLPYHYVHTPGPIFVHWSAPATGPSTFNYEESTDLVMAPYGDTVAQILLHTSPDYRSSADFSATSTLRYAILSAAPAVEIAAALPLEVILFRRDQEKGWVERDRWISFWREEERDRREFTLFIPDTLMGREPAVAWSVRRDFRGSAYFLPDSPGLLIRDPAAFEAELYGTADP